MSEPELNLPPGVSYPHEMSDERLLEVLLVVRKEEASGTACECANCRAAAREVYREAERRGMTGLPS